MRGFSNEERYQNQPYLIRFWRRRYYLAIPYWCFTSWLRNVFHKDCLTIKGYWSISIGLAQSSMGWFYHWDEIVEGREVKLLKEKNNGE